MAWSNSNKRIAMAGGVLIVMGIVIHLIQSMLADPEQLADSGERTLIYVNLGVAVLAVLLELAGGILCLVGILRHWRAHLPR